MDLKIKIEPNKSDVLKLIEENSKNRRFYFIFNNKTVDVPILIADLISPKIRSVHITDPLFNELRIDLNDTEPSLIDILINTIKGIKLTVYDLNPLVKLCQRLGCIDIVNNYLPEIDIPTINDRITVKKELFMNIDEELQFVKEKGLELNQQSRSANKVDEYITVEAGGMSLPSKSLDLIHFIRENGFFDRIQIKTTNETAEAPVSNILLPLLSAAYHSGPYEDKVFIQIDFQNIEIKLDFIRIFTAKGKCNPSKIELSVFENEMWTTYEKAVNGNKIPYVSFDITDKNHVTSICLAISSENKEDITLGQLCIFGKATIKK